MKKMKTLCIAIGLMASHYSHSQANTNLSNLTTPTAVNQNLTPGTNGTLSLGSATNQWNSLFLSGSLNLPSLKLVHDNLDFSLFLNSTGSPANQGDFNTAVGVGAGSVSLGGHDNSMFGYNAGNVLNNGDNNSIFGANAGSANTWGNQNSFFGESAGRYNIDGDGNSFIGYESGKLNTTGYSNTAVGNLSLSSNTIGSGNIAIGSRSLLKLIDGNYNIAVGQDALYYAINNTYDVAIGNQALFLVSAGTDNVAIGNKAGYASSNITAMTAIGANAGSSNNTGMYCTFVGYGANPTSGQGNLYNSSAIGNNALVHNSNTMTFGNTDVLRWNFGRTSMTANRAIQVGTTTFNGNGASLTSGGTWTNASSRSFKSDLQELDAHDVLDRVNRLELTRWKYNETDEYHIGPMAEQFYELFKVGVDDVSVSTIDPAGVALVSIQALSENDEMMNAELESLRRENAELKDEVSEMKQCIARLCELEYKMEQMNVKHENAASIISVAPNPSNASTSILCSIPEHATKASLVITNAGGKVVSEHNINGNGNQKIEVNTAALANGTYACVLVINNVIVSNTMIMVAH